MQEEFCHFLSIHWVGASAFAAAFYISFVNALPERRQDFDLYQVTYHTMRGLIPMSRQSAPPPPAVPDTQRVVVGVKK